MLPLDFTGSVMLAGVFVGVGMATLAASGGGVTAPGSWCVLEGAVAIRAEAPECSSFSPTSR